MQDGLPEDLFGQALPQDRQHGSASAPQATSHEGMHKMLDDYFGKDEDLAQADLFLKRYIASRVSLVRLEIISLCSVYAHTNCQRGQGSWLCREKLL